MKFYKTLCILLLVFFSFESKNIYANSDISTLIFSDASKLKLQSEIIFDTTNNSQISQDTKNEIDSIINSALEKAAKQEAEKSELKDLNTNKIIEDTIFKNNDNSVDTDIIKFAKTLLDTPYVYGGATLKGFDCSGFVKYVFSNSNINIPRTTYKQIKQGYTVELKDIKENDLLKHQLTINLQMPIILHTKI